MFEDYEREIDQLRSKYGEIIDVLDLQSTVLTMRRATTSREVEAAQTRFKDIISLWEEDDDAYVPSKSDD